MVEIKKLAAYDLEKAINLSREIFKPQGEEDSPFHDAARWKEYLDKGGLLLGAFVDGELAGYNLGYPVDDQEFHLWMGGVAERFRGTGLATHLLEEEERLAKEQGYRILTVNTYQEKFPVMFSFLSRHGYSIYKQEEKDWRGDKVIKSYFRKEIV